MTFEENSAICDLRLMIDQTREVLDLLYVRHFQEVPSDEASRTLFVRGFPQMESVLALIDRQLDDISHGLNDLAAPARINQ